MTDWQDIETAPKDRTVVDLWAISKYHPEGKRFPDCFWGQGSFTPRNFPERWRGLPDNPMNWEATHWMLPPEPPP